MQYTREDVIRMSTEVHGDKYDYSITQGVNNKLGKIKYICPIHGTIEQVFNNHLQGKGCLKCANKHKGDYLKLTNDSFLSKASKKHTDINNYDLSNIDMNNRDSDGKIEMICKKHGKFKINPMYFIKGYGCPICYGKEKSDEEVRKELSKIHSDLDFSETKYSERDSKRRIKVICPKHGEQWINYNNLKNGQGCYYCGRERTALRKTITNEEFIKRGKEIYGDKYSYERLDMLHRDQNGRVIVTCKKHGDFKALPDFFYHGHACPKCNESKLEREIRTLLDSNQIEYIYQCSKKDLEWLGLQSIDFYLPKYNIGIECQGIQHFEPSSFTSKKNKNEENLIIIQKRDKIKLEKCIEHNVKLLYYADYEYEFPYKVVRNKEQLLEEIKKGANC